MKRIAVVLALLLAACLSPGEGAPKALQQYLSELQRHDYRAAYDRTQFAQLVRSFGPAAPLSFEHFEAFYRAHPLRRYVIRHVARLDRRSFESPQRPGTPFYEVDVDLTYPEGTHQETFTIEGDILGVVTVEPDRILLRSSSPLRTIHVDGIATRIARAEGSSNIYSLLVIQGRHELRIGNEQIEVATAPLRVLSGPATIGSAPNAPPVIDVG